MHLSHIVGRKVSRHDKSDWMIRSGFSISSEAARDAAGIVVVTLSLLIYGVLQERIMTVGFGPAQELFSASIFLVLCNRWAACMHRAWLVTATRLSQIVVEQTLIPVQAVHLRNKSHTPCRLRPSPMQDVHLPNKRRSPCRHPMQAPPAPHPPCRLCTCRTNVALHACSPCMLPMLPTPMQAVHLHHGFRIHGSYRAQPFPGSSHPVICGRQLLQCCGHHMPV